MTRMPDRKRYTPFLLWAPLTCAIMLSLAAPAEAQKTSYWRGFRYPTVVQFNSSLPDDVALAAKSLSDNYCTIVTGVRHDCVVPLAVESVGPQIDCRKLLFADLYSFGIFPRV